MRVKAPLVLLLIATLGFPASASAHDLLIEIEPAAGAVVEQSEFEAKLTFNNPLLVVEGEINAELSTKLVGTETWVNQGILVLDNLLTAQVNLTEPGEYELRWKVVSSDGHPISGTSTFTLETDAPTESEDTTAPIVIAPSPVAQESAEAGSMVGFYIGLAMVILGVIFAPIGLYIRRRARRLEA
jgi:methionine-rich copper-binding protein CopC